ncbi:putative clathrin assembly protein At2g25430 [Phoenix dactylifera]|uniref:Clathrin assembly protein At2g25430 n=1 Tax=Phoenix dactylifera TaxID=42345 RepID=A0A8B7BSU2_PHODC|nr:putative clathrin assembly protein At2g25430 [Phoenix dactylifera]
MAPSTIRKALGTVKDQTSIGLAKVSSNIAPDLDVAVVKATSHDDEPADEKYLREILSLTSYSRAYVNACIATVSRRLGKTHNYIVALKSLMLVHRLLMDGDPAFQNEILYATRRGTRLLNMADFRDDTHSNSWDHSAFVRTYALYLDQRLECMVYEQKQHGSGKSRSYQSPRDHYRSPPRHSDYREPDAYTYGSYGRSSSSSPPGNGSVGYEERQRGEERKPPTPLRDMKPERVLGRMHQLQQLLDRFLACRPTGAAKHSRMILIALYPIVRESFQLYADICEILAVLLDRFFDMDYPDCVKAFEAYASAAKQIDELCAFYGWCKDTGVARSSEYPEVQRITDKLLETLEEFMRDKARRPKSPPRETAPETLEEEPAQDMNSIKALPAPSDYKEQQPEPEPEKVVEPPKRQQQDTDLVNLRDDASSAEDQSSKLALALFSGPGAATGTNGSWEAFPSNGAPGQGEVTSAWQTPAAEPGKADWELALVETTSNLAKQKAALAGGFDPLLLNGMYDQGAVRQQVKAPVSTGSASSVALPGPGQKTTPVLALPAPDGTVETIGQDPFAASLSFPPPSYVQMADMENKQQLLVHEQQIWQQYAKDGMQGQASLAKLNNSYNFPNPAMPYGMPAAYNGGYGYPTY